ncbi:tetratricopeptide repeat protein [Shewanella gaetbuli]|uniref:Flagellar protein MotX n=1 Tax=Shewanella gaetbuli TaxID=220752 RepID=A0A9X1ZWL5_9GAMM|nr:flagellar protein MotX [Shewanella gaetbuli]MCL1143781.1 flagellar protein MotX [Shewanella gaetbuli]
MVMFKFLLLLSIIFFQGLSAQSVKAESAAFDIYSDEQLINLIRNDQYLKRVKLDECQLVQDIEARAEVLQQPLYQFLWGEMLAHGVCVKAHPARGVAMLQTAAEQGSAEAMLKLADYYYRGKYVVKNPHRSVQYTLPAAAQGNVDARLMLVKLFAEGYGSPNDYEMGYHWLYNSIFDDEKKQREATSLLQQLAAQMPTSIVERAQQQQLYIQ